MNAREIIAALGGRWYGRSGMARCPAHDDHVPSLSIGEGREGQPLLFCFAGCEWPDIRNALRARGLWPGREPAGPRFNPAIVAPRRAKRQCDDKQRIEAARRLWASGRPLTHDDAAGRYLTSRGLPGPWPGTLKFLPNVRHPSGAVVPALVAAACRWPNRAPAAVQFTALTLDGCKAPIEPVRWTRGVLRGAAARLALWEKGRPVVLVEGVEDGLAVLRALPGATPWAVLGTGNAADVALPNSAEIILAFDGDKAGRGASDATSATLWARGHQLSIVPLPDGKDLSDLLRAKSLATLATLAGRAA